MPMDRKTIRTDVQDSLGPEDVRLAVTALDQHNVLARWRGDWDRPISWFRASAC
jgi:hypothetical protein